MVGSLLYSLQQGHFAGELAYEPNLLKELIDFSLQCGQMNFKTPPCANAKHTGDGRVAVGIPAAAGRE